MPGFGVHTFKLLNKAGQETYVKFHWIPKCGVPSIHPAVCTRRALWRFCRNPCQAPLCRCSARALTRATS